MADDGGGSSQELRRDAANNRQRIVTAAGEVFAELGLDAGFDEVARRAGVGIATVYRRFPRKTDLIQALFDEKITLMVARAEEALAEEDPWESLCRFLDWALQLQVENAGLRQVLTESSVDGLEGLQAGRARLEPILDELTRRAQDDGHVRTDVSALHLRLVVVACVSPALPDDLAVRRRLLGIFLDGLAHGIPPHAEQAGA